MPDGKRSSLPPEGETEGVNCFYDGVDEIQNSNSTAKRLPLSLNTRGYHNLSERLLKTMVANEIKKTLDIEDNKKLVAHHRPVLHSENEINDSDMVVVGVVLNAKQSQNDEVSKAIEMLRRNGVSCVYFTIKDQPGGNVVKKDEVAASENGTSFSLEKNTNEHQVQEQDENLNHSEILDTTEKKVSSPTISTTSDYNSHPDEVLDCTKTIDTSCTSTTFPSPKTIESKEGPREKELIPEEKGEDKKEVEKDKIVEECDGELDNGPPALSPSPPILFPQECVTFKEECNDQRTSSEPGEVPPTEEGLKNTKASNSLRRKKRRKRMYPYVSRRKSRNKRKKVAVPPPPEIKQEGLLNASEPVPVVEKTTLKTKSIPKQVTSSVCTAIKEEAKNLSCPADPYEFEESDSESPALKNDTFKTPSARANQKVTSASGKKASKPLKSLLSPPGKKRPATKKRRGKGTPRKRLNFSKIRALSPDITEPGSFLASRRALLGKNGSEEEDRISPIKESSCVQPISKDNNFTESNLETYKSETNTSCVALKSSDIADVVKLVSPKNGQCDADIRANLINDTEVRTCDTTTINKLETEPTSNAQVPSNVQTTVYKKSGLEKREPIEFLVPAPPNDSLQDDPDSMQLRRSSFYSSISRNVRTNLEKYLDGRPQDLKPPKKLKKMKNGFLLHHGDNFPDNPEAPYRLHLATQVLLKLNKRRVKFKPKEDKAKSLLSYLKLQPKRVSRVGKHSKPNTEEAESSSASEPTSVFSGEWTVPRKYICNICGQVENAFWDMVMHKGEVHPGIVVTHVELSDNPPDGFRKPPTPRTSVTISNPPPCSKCSTAFSSYDDLHRHIFECAGNATVLEAATPKVVPRKKKGKRKRGFKRRFTSLPKKNVNVSIIKNPATTVIQSGEITKRRHSEVFKCEFCAREFKTEGWLKNHSLSHSLPVSIPLEKLSLPTRASFSSSRRITTHLLAKPSKQLSRET